MMTAAEAQKALQKRRGVMYPAQRLAVEAAIEAAIQAGNSSTRVILWASPTPELLRELKELDYGVIVTYDQTLTLTW